MSLTATSVGVVLGGSRVLDSVDLALAAGEIVAVVGANGAGKSTLLKVMAGLVAPDAGAVVLDGRPLGAWSVRERARRIAFLPQERRVAWAMSVRSVVALGRLPYRSRLGPRRAEDEAAIAQALAAMDVAGLAERSVDALSGGERARVLIARALAQGAGQLLADEPTAGLDPAHALRLFAHLRQLAGAGRSVLVATHDLSLAARYAHRVLVLAAGRRLALGPPSQVLTAELLALAFGVRAVHTTIGQVPVVVPLEPLT